MIVLELSAGTNALSKDFQDFNPAMFVIKNKVLEP